MADRNCKSFSPNYFNPTKCQNCFKPKEQHSEQQQTAGNQATTRKISSLARNTPPSKTVLKESVLYKATLDKEDNKPEEWEKSFFRLFSNGELQEFAIVNSQVDKENIKNTLMLQDFIRMLDGKKEIAEDLCFGVKTLRSVHYFKAISKVDYENWWKEFSSFVAAPILKRISTTSSPSTQFTRATNYTKPTLTKQLSLPMGSMRPRSPTTRSSRSSSSSTIPEIDHTEMENLRGQVSRLEEENSKLAKSEEHRRKLELEVNYWKEYVTNAQQLKRSGGTIDTATELSDTRKKLIQTQDEVNETQKRLKMNSGKLIMQNRELSDTKLKLQEANSLVAVYKAKIEQMAKELIEKNKASKENNLKEQKQLTGSTEDIFYSPKPTRSNITAEATSSPTPEVSGAQQLEDKFLVLKDRMKRIEKELFLKSKELEKANESRGKVAKYTRSLLQELESRLSDTQLKLNDSEEKLKHVSTELKMERERRLKLEEGPRRRLSSVASPPKSMSENVKDNAFTTPESPSEDLKSLDFTEHDADTKYADYYRSRFKEAEDALLEKDKKLHQAEEKIKQIQTSMKSSSDSYKVINELQTKLSDATHKLSDRQLKIHELTREIDRLRGYEKTYEKKTQQCNTLEEIVKDLEKTNSDQNKNLHQVKQELEILRIREVVLKEQLQTLLEDSDVSDDDEEEDEKARLHKTIALKNQIHCMVELEAQVKKLTLDNENLTTRNHELEQRLRNANIQHFKTLESGNNVQLEDIDEDVTGLVNKIKELQSKLTSAEDRHCDEMSTMKEKHYKEVAAVEKDFKEKTEELRQQLSTLQAEKEEGTTNEDKINGLRDRINLLNLKVTNLEDRLGDEIKAHKQTESTLAERSNLVKEMEAQCQRLTLERDALKGSTSNRRDSYGVYDDDSVEGDDGVSQLTSENHELKVKVRQLERKLRVSVERYEDIVASMREKGLQAEGKEKDRDSGIVITQEIKNLMDTYKMDDELIEDNFDYTNILENLSTGITPESPEEEASDKYKQLSANLARQLEELGKKFIINEEKSLELTVELEQRQTQEAEYTSGYNLLLERIEDLNQQVIESQEVLQSKAEELESKCKNVLNFAEVSGAYVKELEGSLNKSKVRIQDLQNTIEQSKQAARPPPEGGDTDNDDDESDEKDEADGLAVSKPKSEPDNRQSEDMSRLHEILSARVMSLESEMAEMKERHEDETANLKEQISKSSDELGKTKGAIEQDSDTDEETEKLLERIDVLEEDLEIQQENFANDLANLTDRFQEELKSAFSGDQGTIDLLTRLQEIEVEMMKTKTECEQTMKETKEQHEKEKEQMKDDMATVLQATISSMGGDFSQPMTPRSGDDDTATVDQLQDRIIELEQELIDLQERYEEELEMEKEAHQAEMEDTIRDMMTVRTMSNQIQVSSSSEDTKKESNDESNGGNSPRSLSVDLGLKKKIYTSEEVESIKNLYERKISAKEEEHQDALDQVRNDMTVVISSLKQGSSSDTILELQLKIKDLEQAYDDGRADNEEKLQKVELTLKKSESKNFFAFRRNEEMGAKIYQMQTEIEELDRKHSLEIQIYQERLAALGGGTDIDTKTTDVLKANAELEDKCYNLQLMLNTLRNERDNELETFSIEVREEKREAVEEMTDKVLKLEAIIDDMKENHAKEIESFEKLQRDATFEASAKDNKRIEEIEGMIETLEKNHEKEIEELSKENKKVIDELRMFYEKEIGDIKKRTSSDAEGQTSRRPSVDQTAYVKQATKELREKHDKEIEALKQKYEKNKELMQEQQEREISDIRTQYDEKLKMGYKEGLRRQSVSERRSDGTRIKELITQKEAAESKFHELELKFENDMKSLESRNSKLQNLVSELKSKLNGDVVDSAGQNRIFELASDESTSLEDEASSKKLKEIQEQVERYQRRIEYYREKSQREKTEESHRVSELQSEIVELHKETNNIKEARRKEIYDKEKREKAPGERTGFRRNTDGSLAARRHTDTETSLKMSRPRDPRKRWSNLEERSEKEEGKSGTVSARKSLWESIQDEPPSPVSKTTSLPRGLANAR